jgi:hypothetical protein
VEAGTSSGRKDDQIASFVRDEKTGRLAFNAQALMTLGIDPTEARNRGYLLNDDPVRVGSVGCRHPNH